MKQTNFDPLDPGFLADPYPTMRRLRSEAPVHRVSHLDIWAVPRHDAVRSVLRDPSRFSSELGLGRGWTLRDDRPPAKEMSFQAGLPGLRVLIGADPPDHTQLRKIVGPALSPPRIAVLREQLKVDCAVIVDRVVAAGRDEPIDLITALAQPISSRGLATVLGFPNAIALSLSRWALEVTSSWDPTHPNSLASSYQRLARTGWDMLRGLRTLLANRDQIDPCGAVAAMLAARDADPAAISEMEVLSNTVLLVLAGVHTTALGLASVLHRLATDPSLLEALRIDPSITADVVEESLRLESPIQATWRGVKEEVAIGDVIVPSGARIWLMLGSANRDEERYPAAEKLTLGRRGRDLTFGEGIHHCIGMQLSLTQLVATVDALVDRVSRLRLAGPVLPTTNLIVRGVHKLPATLVPS